MYAEKDWLMPLWAELEKNMSGTLSSPQLTILALVTPPTLLCDCDRTLSMCRTTVSIHAPTLRCQYKKMWVFEETVYDASPKDTLLFLFHFSHPR